MMNVLSGLFVSRVRAEVLRLLFEREGHEVHLRELQRQSGLALGTIQQDLKKLKCLDLVQARRDGNRLYYAANASHPLYPEIRNIVQKTAGIVGELARALAVPEVQVAFIFGSIAEGREKAESDVDLFVVGDIGLRKLVSLISGLSSRLGREINPYVLTSAEFARRVKAKEHFVTRVLESRRTFVVGGEDGLKGLARKQLAQVPQDKRGGGRKSSSDR